MTANSGSKNPRWAGEKFCIVCQKPLVSPKERKNKTCSLICNLKSKIISSEKHPRWSGKKMCVICGKELVGSDNRKKKTCSPACATSLRSNNRLGKGNPRWRGGEVKCKQCGKEIMHAHRLHVSFCSRKCVALWQSINLSKENSPLWTGGSAYKDYPPEFNMKLRSSIRKRDCYECQSCSKRQNSLDVHHIDQNKNNNSPKNLISLCRSCHKKVHWGRIIINEKNIVAIL